METIANRVSNKAIFASDGGTSKIEVKTSTGEPYV
jgi:hypothetical protein